MDRISSDVVFGSRPEPPFVTESGNVLLAALLDTGAFRSFWREAHTQQINRIKNAGESPILVGQHEWFSLSTFPLHSFFRVELGSVQTKGRCHDDTLWYTKEAMFNIYHSTKHFIG